MLLPALCAAGASMLLLPGTGALGVSDLAGRYTIAALPAKTGATLAEATYGGSVDIVARRHAYGVTWRLAAADSRKLRGLGMVDGDSLLAVSIATGGAAYGVAVYHRVPDAREWRGQWITSLDSGVTPGQISFDEGDDGALPGRHRLHCQRPGVGGFDGAVNIAANGGNFLLTFLVDGTVLYRGAGILLEDGRLAVGWSFGSSPALAVYRIGADGLLRGERISPRAGEETEDLARSGDDAARLLPAAARIDPALVPADVDAGLEPDAPDVKSWVYDELTDRYGAEGWAERWLDGQLTPEEHALLDRAVRRAHLHSRAAKTGARPTIGDMIEQERRRADD